LGHRLPLAYVALAHRHNGGLSAHDAYPAPSRTTWAGSRPWLRDLLERAHRRFRSQGLGWCWPLCGMP